MFKQIQEKIYTPTKFYDVFLDSDAGKLSFESAYNNFTLPYDKDLFVDFIIGAMQDWLFEQLTDDEMNAAYTLFQSLELELRNIIITSMK